MNAKLEAAMPPVSSRIISRLVYPIPTANVIPIKIEVINGWAVGGGEVPKKVLTRTCLATKQSRGYVSINDTASRIRARLMAHEFMSKLLRTLACVSVEKQR